MVGGFLAMLKFIDAQRKKAVELHEDAYQKAAADAKKSCEAVRRRLQRGLETLGGEINLAIDTRNQELLRPLRRVQEAMEEDD